MNQAVTFCQKILPRVSRSFTLTIPMLDQDIYLPVLVTYLQDRLLDNFEDEIPEQNITLEQRKEMMDQVVELFNPANRLTAQLSRSISSYAPLMPDQGLRELTANAALVREAYQGLSAGVKAASFKWLQEMNRGMQKFLTTPIESFQELDEYCYYVAGTVGGFLTDTILLKRELPEQQALNLIDNFKAAGLFLQKVNLVRDVKKDLRERNKNYWPLKSLKIKSGQLLNPLYKEGLMQALTTMLTNIKSHIPNLVAYLEALPQDLPGYRKFFCVNNALGLGTIERLENNDRVFFGRKEVKTSKKEFVKILNSPERVFYEKTGYLQRV